MSNYAKLYWLTRLDSIHNIFIGIGVFLTIFFVLHILIYGLSEGDSIIMDKPWKRNLAIVSAITLLCLAALVPDRNEAIFIVAGGMTLDYAQKDTSLQKLPYQATQIISKYMDKKVIEMATSIDSSTISSIPSPDEAKDSLESMTKDELIKKIKESQN